MAIVAKCGRSPASTTRSNKRPAQKLRRRRKAWNERQQREGTRQGDCHDIVKKRVRLTLNERGTGRNLGAPPAVLYRKETREGRYWGKEQIGRAKGPATKGESQSRRSDLWAVHHPRGRDGLGVTKWRCSTGANSWSWRNQCYAGEPTVGYISYVSCKAKTRIQWCTHCAKTRKRPRYCNEASFFSFYSRSSSRPCWLGDLTC